MAFVTSLLDPFSQAGSISTLAAASRVPRPLKLEGAGLAQIEEIFTLLGPGGDVDASTERRMENESLPSTPDSSCNRAFKGS